MLKGTPSGVPQTSHPRPILSGGLATPPRDPRRRTRLGIRHCRKPRFQGGSLRPSLPRGTLGFGVNSMHSFRSVCLALLASIAQTLAPNFALRAQVVHMCCTTEDCKNRHIKPNLQLSKPTHLFGVLADPSGAPFKRSKVELRKWISATDQASLKVVETDNGGRFDIGMIEAGRYRFLPSASRGFKQPESLSCPEAECRVELVLQVNPTDTPDSVCPVR